MTIDGYSQVGINTTAPDAMLQIKSSNQVTPSNTDGVLIPKIDAFPVTNPTAAQQGMMVFLTAPASQSGFYYWDNTTTSWKPIAASQWTTTGANISNNNSGNVGIGTGAVAPSSLLTVKGNSIGFTQEDSSGVSKIGFFTNAGGAWLQTHSDTNLSFATNDGATQMVLESTTGNLGIGYVDPDERLSVNGKTRTTDLQVTTGAGLGKVLTSDVAGNATWQVAAAANGWNLTGNSGTDALINFIGTIDSVDVVFKRNNIISGKLNGTNTSFGYESLTDSNTGINNTAIGRRSMFYNTTGFQNVAIGLETLYANDSGSNNTAIGNFALPNSNADYNTAVGSNAMANNNSGASNVAVGAESLYNNFDGNNNVSVGQDALHQNSSGSNNTAIGFSSGNLTTGSGNITIGANANTISATGNNQMSIANVIYGDAMDNIETARFSIGDLPSINNKFYTYSRQLTANGDGQSSIYGYRTRDSQNDGTGYSRTGTNKAISGYNLWGDLYTFGVTGHCYNDFTRTGGVLGANFNGLYWASLGYKNSASTTYGVYATAALATGAGRFSQPQKNFSIGGGFYGGMIGSWSKGNSIGQVSSGSLFASYNSGDEYTVGKQIELVDTGNQKTAAYTVTSTESIVYKKGKATLRNGATRIDFDKNYCALLGEIPVVTVTPMGQCNGIYIESIDQKGFTIRELNNGSSNVAISWIAVGNRIDAQQNKAPKAILDKDFDNHINEVMFNENNKFENAKAIWFDGANIQFGQLPSEFIDKSTDKKE